MQQNSLLNNFDPISFLGITPDPGMVNEQVEKLRNDLKQQVSEYVIYKLALLLTEDQLEILLRNPVDPGNYKILKTYLPNLEELIVAELNNFKKEYNSK